MSAHPGTDPAQDPRNAPPHAPRPWPLPVTQSPTIRELTEQLARLDRARSQAWPDADANADTDRGSGPGPDSGADAYADSERLRITDQFIARLTAQGGTPLVEPAASSSHRIVTFIYRGPAADRVYLQANKLTDNFAPTEGKLTPIPGTDLATLSLEMPSDWICSYFYLTPPTSLDPSAGRLRIRDLLRHPDAVQLDALNPLTTPYKLLPKTGQSLLVLEDAPQPPATASIECWPASYSTVTLPNSGAEVEVVIRSHPDADADSTAVLLCDGEVWLRDDLLAQSLSARDDCPPLHLVFLPSGGTAARQRDYTADPDAQARILGLARDSLRVVEPKWDARWILVGQSLGGLFAMLGAVRFPDVVHGAVAQSPSLWWPSDAPLERGAGQWFTELGAAGASAPCVVQVGRTEWLLTDSVLHGREFLRGLGSLVETPHDLVTGGHDEAWWRRTLPEAIVRRCGEASPG
ncbi:MAG: enterochelin esterase domain-containing protein [Gulosibacter sp.]|uniref:enterochelin esterase domain-containing protein n=1 Tax=Gulosibacter sp. TaxID=2817531 RepID=UPI003F9328D4